MGILSAILSFFGSSNQTRKEEEQFSKEMEALLATSFEAFNSRPIHTELTEEIINQTADEDLLQVIFDHLITKQPTNDNDELHTILSWNKSRQAIYMIWILEAEVNNGGFNQFYYNSSGAFYPYLPDALSLVGATHFAQLTKQANAIFESEHPSITQHQDGTLQGFSQSYDDNPLNDLDDQFYDLYATEQLEQLQIEYIRENVTDFIDE